MAKHTMRDRRREAYWRKLVEGQGRSGLTVRAFCRQSGVTESAFYFWRRELERRRTEHGQPRRAGRRRGRLPGALPSAAAAFLPVVVKPEQSAPPGRIEIELSGGRRIHVTAPVDRAALADVLAVLSWEGGAGGEEGRPCAAKATEGRPC